MAASVSLLLINYHSAALAIRAIQSARQASAAPLQVVVVDNSSDTEEARRLHSSGADELLQPPRNLGYAGGINYGAGTCRGEYLVICNADIVIRPGCIDRLVDALRGDVAMAGPRFTWDDRGRWLMPPAELATRRQKLSQAIATRSTWWAQRRDRARIRSRLRFWSRSAPARVRAISGAVMALRREVLQSLGGFDERFSLYYEEIDFMRRIALRGLAIEHVPGAVCRHLYNQSAAQSSTARGLYLTSEREYHRKWSGGWFVRLAEAVAATPNGAVEQFQLRSPEEPIEVPTPPERYLVEASPLRSFEVATGYFPEESAFRFPPEIWSCYRDNALFLRLVNIETAEVVARYRFDKSD